MHTPRRYHAPIVDLLVTTWERVPEEHRAVFVTELLSEDAADALLNALVLRQPEEPAPLPSEGELREVWARESEANQLARRGPRQLPPSSDPAEMERRARNRERAQRSRQRRQEAPQVAG